MYHQFLDKVPIIWSRLDINFQTKMVYGRGLIMMVFKQYGQAKYLYVYLRNDSTHLNHDSEWRTGYMIKKD